MSSPLDIDLGVKAQGPQGDTGAQGERGPQGVKGDTGAQGEAGKDGHSVWQSTQSHGSNGENCWFTDLVNASASNPPKVNDIMINAEGNMAMITEVNITNSTATGGGTFNYGSWVGNIKGPKGEAGKIYKPYVNENGDLHAKLINPDGTDATA